jgi:SAM-dependent methyltransferase
VKPQLKNQAIFSDRSAGADAALVSRIRRAYRHAVSTFQGYGNSQWASNHARSFQLHQMLLNGTADDVAFELDNPATNDLLYGFDEATRAIYVAHQAGDQAARDAWGAGVHKRLIRLAEAVGAIPVWLQSANRPDDRDLNLETLLAKLDETLGFTVDFPNPYPNELGLESSRGLINHRAVFAIYQAWRLVTWARTDGGARVLEIGAGSGRTAYYAFKLGLRDYTIVDLPLTNVAQANFLGRVLDPSLIVLSGEDRNSQADRIRIFGPSWFERSAEVFDVAINADSITEMDCVHATAYFEKLAGCADVFVSINHEANPFSTKELPAFAGVLQRPLRYPYWLDDSYVEETFLFHNRAPMGADAEAEIKRLGRIVLDLRQRTASMDSMRALARRLIELTRRRLVGR